LELPYLSVRIPKCCLSVVGAAFAVASLCSGQTSPTSTVLSAAPATLDLGSVVTLAATVTSNGQPVTAGVIQFVDGTRLLGAVQVIRAGACAGTATLKTASFAAGSHNVVASYSGSPNGSQKAAVSQSAPVAVHVLGSGVPFSTNTSLFAQGNAAEPGAYVLTATVTTAGLAPPTGSVIFQDETAGKSLGTAILQGPVPQQAFLAPKGYPMQATYPTSVAVGDFNNDGLPDIAVADIGDQVVVLLADPANPGQFLPSVGYPAGKLPQFVATYDVNADGILDLIVANDLESTIGVLLGDPAHPGQFLPPVAYAVGSRPTGITINDFNLDGVPDLAVTNQADDTISVLLGDPTHPGSFLAQSTYGTYADPIFVASADLDGDGYPDLVITTGANAIQVFTADPANPGKFVENAIYPAGIEPYAIALADLNHDGKIDVVVTNQTVFGVSSVGVMFADPSRPGQFLAPVMYAVSAIEGPQSTLAIGDLNGDGVADLVVSESSVQNNIDVLLGDPSHPGQFFSPVAYHGPGAAIFAEADVNGDGVPDLVMAPSQNDVSTNDANILLGSLTTSQTATLSNVVISGPGLHSLAANFQGNTSSGSSSGGVTISVPSPTTTVLTISPSAAALGSGVQMMAAVSVNGMPVVSGWVRFSEGSRTLGTASVQSNGQAVLKTGSFTSGAHQIIAAYSGAPYSPQTVAASTSIAASLVVSGIPASVTNLTETANAANPVNVDLLATVLGLGFAPPAGAIAFSNPTTGRSLGTVPLAGGLLGFLARGSYPAGSAPGMLVAGDFNGDGIQDLAILQFAAVTVLLADPNHPGQFGAPVTYDTGQDGAYLTAADVNGDGVLDLLVANGGSNNVSVFLGDAQHPGQFLPAVNYPTGNEVNFLAVGDFNQDGLTDIAVINYQDQTIGLLFQDPAHPGQFLPQVIVASRSAGSNLVVGDFNRDGVADLAVADGGVSIYLGDPTRPGQFLAHIAYSLSTPAVFLAAGDFNGDGLIDLVAAGTGGTAINVLLADPNHPGQFLAPLLSDLASASSSITVADFNGDGLADVVIGGEVFLNDRTHPGQFLITGIVPPGSPAGSSFVAVADFNADGVPDMVTSGFAGGTVNNVNVFFGAASSTALLSNVSSSQTVPEVLAAAYAGNANYSSNVSNGVPAVIPQPTITNLLLSSPNPVIGDLITFTATVFLGQTPVRAGTVSFKILPALGAPSAGTNIIGTAQVVSSGTGVGTATFRIRALPSTEVTQTIVAIYNGSLGAASSTSNLIGLQVGGQLIPSLSFSTVPNAINPHNYDMTVQLQGAGTTPPLGKSVIIRNPTTTWFTGPVSPVSPAPVTFLPATNYATGNRPDSVVTADFNSDGIPDMAIANYVDSTVSILLSDASNRGHFLPEVTYQLAAGFSPQALAVGDLNGDGLLDLAVAGLNSTTILLSSSSSPGQFVVGGTYAGGTLVAAADLDGDGLLDLITGPSASALVNVLLGDPARPGQFVPGAVAVTSAGVYTPTSLAVGDFNGDSIPDLALGFETPSGAANPTGGYLSVLLGDPYRPGKFLPPANHSDVGTPLSVATADLNLDGSLDLLINGSVILFADKSLPGQFLAPVSLGVAATSMVAVGDLNGDGIPDIAELTPSSALLFLGNSAAPGTFLPVLTEPTTGNSIALGDFNGDAKADLSITTPSSAPGVTVLLSSSISTATIANVFLPGAVGVLQPVQAEYNGDPVYAGALSNTLMLNGSGDFPIQISLSASPLTVPVGGVVSFIVSAGYEGVYNLYDGATLLDSVTVAVGQPPTFSESFTTSGPHVTKASYAGTNLHLPSTSNTITITVTGAPSTGTINAIPNPISVPLGVTVGATTITWNSTQASTVEVHIGAPNGVLFGGGGPTGSAQTGPWVTDGMTFYLQDTTGGNPLTAANTLATVVVHVVQQTPQSSFSANPNPIIVSMGTIVGVSTITWSAPQATTVELHVGSPAGTLFSGGGPTGSAQTGSWVTDRMTFYLQDTTGGKSLTAAHTIATLIVHVEQQVEQLSFSANPNPIIVASGGFLGSTLLQWDASGVGSVEIRVGSPTGILFAGGGASGSAQTGQWVSDGMTFYLQDTSGGKALSSANTLAMLVVHLQAQGLLTASPNPIPIAEGSAVGATTVAWNAGSSPQVEVHVGAPNGTLFARGGPAGSAATGEWVTDGMTFYLQDVSDGKELSGANTLGTLTVHLQHAQDSASLTATPNPIIVSLGTAVGTTNIAWDAPFAQAVEIHVGSPSGSLFAAGGPAGSAETGAWVTDGMTFYLQDTTGGKRLTSANTIAILNVTVQPQ
jgi:hypothetical protein